jgi:fluoroacetyl-CoA thioesterase
VEARVTTLPGLCVGAERTIRYRVGPENMVQRLLPGVTEFARKPEVMATGWLVGVCEWPAMDALREYMTDSQCSLGTGVDIAHLAPIPTGATLTVTARCVWIDGLSSTWAVDARDDQETVAAGVVSFVVVELERFTRRRLQPKAAHLSRAVDAALELVEPPRLNAGV